jgi:triacylglycerol lipase
LIVVKRRPVVLVPGWSDRARHLRRLRDYLIDAGWPAEEVTSVDFKDRYGSNIDHAAEIAEILRARPAAGMESIDVVAHSMGGLAVRYLLQHHAEGRLIRRVVFMATPHRGTWAAYLGWGAGAAQMRMGSDFLRALGGAESDVELLTIHTPLDLRIFPGTSAQLSSGRDHRVWCLGHRALLRSRKVHRLVQNLLES